MMTSVDNDNKSKMYNKKELRIDLFLSLPFAKTK